MLYPKILTGLILSILGFQKVRGLESVDVDLDGYEYVASLMEEDTANSSIPSDLSCTTTIDSSYSIETHMHKEEIVNDNSFMSKQEYVDSTDILHELGTNHNVTGILNNVPIVYPYNEKMNLRPLPNNHLLTSFIFDMRSEPFYPNKNALDPDQYSHYTVFPKAIKPLLEVTSTRQLQLRFTRGYWDSETWGALPYNGFKSGGSGVEMWATIEANSKETAYEKWKTLANYLSGHFCASINFIDNSRTSFPQYSFNTMFEDKEERIPLFDQGNNNNSTLYVLHASLANEPVCTENLTPLIKLLPTRGKSGISSFLDGHKVFDSVWHSLSIDIDTLCEREDGQCQYWMEANVDMVIHVPNALERYENPIPKPVGGDKLRCDLSKPYDIYQCFPLPESTDINFSLSQLFNKTIKGCNNFIEHPTTICVQATNEWDITLKIIDTDQKESFFGTSDNCFELDSSKEYDVIIDSQNSQSVKLIGEAPIYVSRSLTGYGQDHGGIRTVLRNPNKIPVKIIFYESLPWFMRIYLSTLTVESTDQNITSNTIMESMYYSQARDRERPSHIEFLLDIPALTTVTFSYQFDKTLLQFSEYPPDANHGFEIEAAVITVLSPVVYQLRTSTLLLLLSTPDFSMPYNVIIITSTIMGLIFGVMYNLLVKRVVTLEEADKILTERSIKYRLLMLKQRVLSKIGLNP